jgi:dTDP-4-dehydrorhamnose 3,5-epimerase
MFTFEPTAIPAVKLLTPERFEDERGWFSETFSRRRLAGAGYPLDFVQDNCSWSAKAGTVRGLHFQISPFAQDKLVWVVSGRVLDVSVDLRRSSPSFGQYVAIELSAKNGRQVLIPVGFAHGFCTLEPETKIIYKVSSYYSADHDRGIAWSDPALGIPWPVAQDEAILSERDRQHPTLAELPPYFD